MLATLWSISKVNANTRWRAILRISASESSKILPIDYKKNSFNQPVWRKPCPKALRSLSREGCSSRSQDNNGKSTIKLMREILNRGVIIRVSWWIALRVLFLRSQNYCTKMYTREILLCMTTMYIEAADDSSRDCANHDILPKYLVTRR